MVFKVSKGAEITESSVLMQLEKLLDRLPDEFYSKEELNSMGIEEYKLCKLLEELKIKRKY